ncbi:TPA: type IV secretion system protein [Klebsiella pneumoniae]|uniref:P-type type IV secretion, polytopic protein/inner membrane complex component n=8 Tax=Gammaproteobacteria TaxID=1236 RepID=A0A4P8WB01_9ENTR|nr:MULTISPECIES: type IV secretion system protein [Enterobacterales]EAX7630457.1 conjugal transfer protein TrbL [Salmonella enterica]EBW7236566.1 conjugal transfer protein TrbL [Salmonella enterica subsp. enterica serovar Senftenberg]ECN3995719.1 conjugal transfer protein TrbL [Salmonella enterica subsp. enterica serovar Infantis]EDU0678329.1 conjugal transfer protein TrbL [Salmonella enterica subsp. enterica serovar Javiana]EGA6787634.1 conjugal transfer protein TrbL [Shigella flexneri]EGT72
MSKNKILIILIGIFAVFPAFALDNAVTQKIDANINEYVNAVLSSSGSDIYVFVMAVATFLMFVCAVGEIIKFIYGQADWVAIFTLIIVWFVTMALITSYGMVTDTVKYAFNELADTFQYLTIGSKDRMFLSNFIDRVINQAVQAPDVGFTDTIYMWAITIIWAVISLFLQVAFYLSDVYVTLGIALAQMIGVLFIPFLIAPWTRGIFDGWVRFMIGWGVCGIVLRLTCLLTMLVMKATINAAGDFQNPGTALINSNYDVSAPLVVTDENLGLLIAIIVFGFISCVMIFSSFTFAKMLSSGVGDTGKAVNNTAKKLAAQAIKALI